MRRGISGGQKKRVTTGINSVLFVKIKVNYSVIIYIYIYIYI
jgi:hypothetical protein